MRSSRYDLHIKVPSNSTPGKTYVVRRRVLDGGYECSCPRWNEAREECAHVAPIKLVMSRMPRVESPLERRIKRVFRTHSGMVYGEAALIEKVLAVVRSFRVE